MPRACAQAVSNNADGAVVQALLDAPPSAVRELDARGYLPLHLAAQHGACGDVVHRLLFAYHDAAWTACGWRKDLPIHLAAEHQAPTEAVELLLYVYPEGAEVVRHGGECPLHLAAAHKAPLPLVAALFEAAPQLVEVENDAGDLPLHLAVERTAPSAVIDYLLEKYPEAWKRYNKYSTRAEAMGDKKLLLPGE